MAGDEVRVSEEVLEDTAKLLAQCSASIREYFEKAIADVGRLSEDWNDSDFQDMLSAISAYNNELDTLDEKTGELISKAKEKIEMIHALHSINI